MNDDLLKTTQDTIRGLLNGIEILSIERSLNRDRIQDLLVANNKFEERARGAERKLKEAITCTDRYVKILKDALNVHPDLKLFEMKVASFLEELSVALKGESSSSDTLTTKVQQSSVETSASAVTQFGISSTGTVQAQCVLEKDSGGKTTFGSASSSSSTHMEASAPDRPDGW